MPPGAGARGRRVSLLSRTTHEKLTDPSSWILDAVEPWAQSQPTIPTKRR